MEEVFDDYESMYAEKAEHTEAIGRVIWQDRRSGVENCRYYRSDLGEFVRINYKSGGYQWISVTWDSIGLIHKEIVNSVYGFGACGIVEDPEDIERLDREFIGGEENAEN